MVKIDGTGERLEEPDDTFDLVILAGTLDHVLDPAQVLSEARRVVKPVGRIVVQIGIPDSDPYPAGVKVFLHLFSKLDPYGVKVDISRVRDFVHALPIPPGAVDPFHFKYYTEPEIEQLFKAAHLAIARRKRIPGSTFYEMRK
jgi:ubiquinone/menaquinone biosynthesis C-methylase UbiE